MTESISWTIEKFENGSVVLLGSSGNLTIPRSYIAKNMKVGDVVTAEFFLLNQAKQRQANIARSILEEILGK